MASLFLSPRVATLSLWVMGGGACIGTSSEAGLGQTAPVAAASIEPGDAVPPSDVAPKPAVQDADPGDTAAPDHSTVPGAMDGNAAVSPNETLPRPSPPPSPKQTGRLGTGQDPGMVYYRGAYHLVQAQGGSRLTVYRSAHLDTLMTDQAYHWQLPGELVDNEEAPDVDLITDPSDGSQKIGIYLTKVMPYPGTVRVLITADPAAGFEDKGYLRGVNGYDAHYMEHPNGKKYLFFSNFGSILIVQMSNPWTTQSDAVTISHGSLPWESRQNGALNEAPATVVAGGTVNLIYSSNAYNNPDYLCGRITAATTRDPMDPKSWTKDTSGPVFASANGRFGPGSGTFFHDGIDQWWAYGSFPDPSKPVREIRAQTVTFDSEGVVQLGEPR